MDPFDFIARMTAPPLDESKLPPEAATLAGFADAVEEMTQAFNIIAKYDSRTMAEVWNRRIQSGDWEFGPMEERDWPQVVVNAQRIKV